MDNGSEFAPGHHLFHHPHELVYIEEAHVLRNQQQQSENQRYFLSFCKNGVIL